LGFASFVGEGPLCCLVGPPAGGPPDSPERVERPPRFAHRQETLLLGAAAVRSDLVHDLPAQDHAVVLMTLASSIEDCFAVAIDLEAYPEWVESISKVAVEERDDEGRPVRARFEASGVGRRSSYVLAYDLSEAPRRLSWTMVEGDLTRRLEGAYTFEPAMDDEGTDVTYELIVDLAITLPGYVRRRAEDKILEAALRRFGDRVLTTSGNDRIPPIREPRLHRW
jgi:ribosome-associated toxin RatA of RatAB toxin-antitoxin module